MPNAVERFWANTDRRGDDECWEWKGTISPTGYGQHSDGKRWGAHRWAYTHLVGPIPEGLELDHTCHDRTCPGRPTCPHRRCVNPNHLEPVTSRENTLRGTSGSALNALKTHCERGHEFNDENTAIRPDGGRTCVPCKAMLDQRRRDKKFTCPVCGEDRDYSSRARHMRSHNPERIPCELCDQTFTLSTSLTKHMRRKHGAALTPEGKP